jgi:sugar/nucleoside kinase (ribokinase family)
MTVLLKRLHAVECKIAIITDGPNGAYTYDGATFLKMGIFDVPVVERTGCGDAFATGFVAGLQHGNDVGEALRWGTANSASVISYVGPQKGLLNLMGMKKMLKRFESIQPEKI